MDVLPVKISHHIFTLISLEERLECTLVCRSWYQLLNKRSLLYDVCIKSENMFNKFISMLQSLPDRASQVEILNLETDQKYLTDYTFDKRIFCSLFINLREFRNMNHSLVKLLPNHCDKPLELINPTSKLEIIIDGRECEFTRQLLKFSSCSRLKHLKLDLRHFDKSDNRNFYDPRKEIFDHLKNAPALKKLILWSCDIRIDDLEIIHRNVPTLDTLEFKRVRIFTSGLPYNVIPATSVTTLKFEIGVLTNDPNYLEVYKYLAKKYTNLKRIDYDNKGIYFRDSTEKMNIYRKGILPLYKNAGQTLPHFDVYDFPIELNPFKTLDESGVRVSRFDLQGDKNNTIFEQLSESNQSEYVESLYLRNTDITSPMVLQNFASLKRLTIDFFSSNQRWTINLKTILNAVPPTLVFFSIILSHTDPILDELPSHPNNIQYFRLKHCSITPKIAEALSTCFPKLNELYLEGYATENLCLNISYNHLLHFIIIIRNNGSPPHAFSITEGNRLNPRYYAIYDESKRTKSVTAKELQDRVIISIHYTSADYFCCDDLFLIDNYH